MSLALSQPPALKMSPWHSIDTGNYGVGGSSVTGAASGAYPTANLAIYIPLRVVRRVTGVKLWVQSGTTGTGYFDLAVYSSGGTRLAATGSQTKGAAGTEQVVDVTDFTLGPGLYYMAIAASNNTDTYIVDTDAAPMCASQGILAEDLGSPTWTPTGTNILPSTATWTVSGAQALAYYVGMGILLETTVA